MPVDVRIDDGAKVRVARAELTLHVTPGHTRGCTSWTMTAHVGGKPENVLFICSLTVLPDYRLLKQPSYPGIASDYKKSIATLRGLPCDIFLGSHGQFFGMQAKIAKLGGAEDPFIDPAGCRAYIDDAAKAVDDEIVKEQATQ